MASCFRTNLRNDPRHDATGADDPLLKLQLQGYKSVDPGVRQQQALKAGFIRQCYHRATTPRQRAIATLIIIAYFFAMRSCEFSVTSGTRKTKPIHLGGIVFKRRNNSIIPHSSREIFSAFAVSFTFRDQKNREKMETVSQEGGNDPLLNPVIQSATIVWTLRKVPGTSDYTEIYNFLQNNVLTKISQSEVLDYLRAVARSIGSASLGFDPMAIGCKSIRSGTAMGWHLAGHRPEHIMLMGRWKSDAFITYLRRHVLEFCKGMSKSLLQHEFFGDSQAPRASPWDPQQPQRRFPSHGPNSMATSRIFASHPTFNIY